MHRPSNAARLSPRAARVGLLRCFWNRSTARPLRPIVIRTVMAPHLMRGPTPRGGLDDRRIEEVRASEIETRGDHDQLARNGPERAARVPERLQMAEEVSPFVWEGTFALARTGDRTFEEFFKHGRTPFRNPPFSRPTYDYVTGIDVLVSEPESTRRI